MRTALLGLCLATMAQAQALPGRTDTIFVADRYFSDSTTTGARILAKFATAELLDRELRLDAPVLAEPRRNWLFRDILVDITLNANGYVATWRIAGPRTVVEAYLARIQDLARDPKVIYDHFITRLPVRCACD